MPRILTITFHPTIDKFFSVQKLLPNSKLHVQDCIRKAGGGGINVSKILAKHEVSSQALYVSGGYNAALLQDLLKQENIEGIQIDSSSECRENIIIYAEENNLEYRFNMPLEEHAPGIYQTIADYLLTNEMPEILVFSGSIGTTWTEHYYQAIYEKAIQKGTKIFFDSKPNIIKQILPIGAYLIKPNLKEFQWIVGKELQTKEDILTEAKKIIDQGLILNILVSLGSEGAYLINRHEDVFYNRIPVLAVNSVGAGDSLLAGVICGIHQGNYIKKAVSYGIQCAAATVINTSRTMFEWKDMNEVKKLL